MGVIGRLQTRTWDDDKGRHYITEVVAEETYFADSKRDGEGASAAFDNAFGSTMPGGMEADAGTGTGSDFEVSSTDDLPF